MRDVLQKLSLQISCSFVLILVPSLANGYSDLDFGHAISEWLA